ncbi:MAG: TIGR04255 family protein [Bacteroidia bacterium]
MKLPTKIDDNLRDAIVTIMFNALVPETAITGYFHKVMLEQGKFETIFAQPSIINPFQGIQLQPFATGIQTQQQIKISGQPVYTNRMVKTSVTNMSINFNIVESYIGWPKYFTFIKDVLTSLNATNAIENYTRVSVRYISEYRNVSIFDNLKGEFTILNPEKKRQNIQIKTQIEDGNFRIITSIADNFVRPSMETQTVETFSLIEVDSQYLGPQTNNIDQLFSIIDQTHTKEKETFFSIVTDKFIEQLNPKY